MTLLSVAFALALALTTTVGQSRYEPFAQKKGSCPPPIPVQICTQSCFSDSHCSGIGKCCPTNCGGFICAKPVTMRKEAATVKPGSCPAIPKGRWVCSPTCTVDSDCRGSLKCCKNRCGALACQKPEVEEVEDADFPEPVAVPEEPSYMNSRNPFIYGRNRSYNPYNFYYL
ncbi:antileukoproteinase [Xylocopa sonorina]|uniref:antileukoproteinase n=1 Tax=Xylocopa sonorina TaxID=1818115 RepID=UPI00403AE79D